MLTWCLSEYCVPSRLDFEAAGDCAYCILFAQLFALRASSFDMGALSWLNVEVLERVPTPLWRTGKELHPWALFQGTAVFPFLGFQTRKKPDTFSHMRCQVMAQFYIM